MATFSTFGKSNIFLLHVPFFALKIKIHEIKLTKSSAKYQRIKKFILSDKKYAISSARKYINSQNDEN